MMVFFVEGIRVAGYGILAMVAALAYAFSNTFWSQAMIIEVYSLAALMFMLSWLAAVFYLKTAQTAHW